MDENLSSSSIRLVVKASNQQYDDQTIDCQLNWTVRKLKEHLSDVYPSKPKPDDQKLIYSGQLLRDKLILKDIIRHYEGVQSQVHTFHLVCTPPRVRFPTSFGSSLATQQQPKSNQQQTAATSAAGNNNEGLRQRHNVQQRTSPISTASTINQNQSSVSTPAASSFIQNNNIPQMTGITGVPLFPVMNSNCPTGSAGSVIGNNISSFSPLHIPNQHTLAQQIAMQNWMQQAYVQYMNQYMNLLSTGIRPETVLMQNQPITTEATTGTAMNVSGLPQMPYLPQYFPSTMLNANFSSNLTTNSSITTHPPIINPLSSSSSSSSSSSTTATTAAIPPSVIQEQQQQQQPQPQQNQPRFPNIIQNDLQENRDWLDVFYSISRLMVLLTLVYLYSSPIRCFSVFVIGMAIYLYHRAYYYDNNNNNNNNNNGAQAQVRRPQQNVEQQQNVQPNNENVETADAAVNETDSLDSTQERTSAQENNTENATNDTNSSSTNERETNTGTTAVSNVADDSDGTSMIAFLKTFVVSFLVSLFPEAPPV